MRLGAWIDRRGVMKGWEQWPKVAAQLGFFDVSLVAHAQDAGKPFDPFVSASQLGKIIRHYDSLGVRAHVMLWPQPNEKHILAMNDYLGDVVEAAGGTLGSGELDCEEQWTRDRKNTDPQFATLIRAGWPNGLPLAVNGITAAVEKYKTLIAISDKVFPQAYTTTVKGQTSTPGKRQREVYETWQKLLRPEQELCMGLAAYSQDGAGGLSGVEAMHAAYNVVVDLGVREVRYWSLPNFTSGYARKFIGDVRKAAF